MGYFAALDWRTLDFVPSCLKKGQKASYPHISPGKTLPRPVCGSLEHKRRHKKSGNCSRAHLGLRHSRIMGHSILLTVRSEACYHVAAVYVPLEL